MSGEWHVWPNLATEEEKKKYTSTAIRYATAIFSRSTRNKFFVSDYDMDTIEELCRIISHEEIHDVIDRIAGSEASNDFDFLWVTRPKYYNSGIMPYDDDGGKK